MDSSKRRFLGAITTGAALIPVTGVGVSVAGTVVRNNQSPDRHGSTGKRYGMVIDLRKCVGCQACTVSCGIENQTPIGEFRTTVKQYDVSLSNDEQSQVCQSVTLPRLCNHCDNPPCIAVCPVQATFQRNDGIVMVDNQRCVGCAYCVQACPYDARFINSETMTADKCTFCAHRLEQGLLPACVETCVGGARVIGDLNDANSTIRRVLNENSNDVKVLKPEQGTQPHVFYLGLEPQFVTQIDGNAAPYQAQGEHV
ncbi:sulfate reduction electron transfer complex DsrMKJOP subunit DsrO [Vibrio parahaemolyticus]|uniref:sulfate reduction electron transfer complex DsrMKJOP subunit DsrO n=1 Tax=Vibrio mediterranei TaxID=689 RepID=UPI004067BDF6